MQIFHFTVRGILPTGGKESIFFCFKNQKFPNNNLEQIKTKDKLHFPNSFLFSERNQKGKSLFS